MSSAQQPTVCIIGLGYIGLPTASLLATKGFQVHGVDINPKIVDNLNQGRVLIQEPALDVMVKSAVNSGHLKASLVPEPADVFIIAVPTPFKNGHKPDLSYVRQAAEAVAPKLRPGNLVILESTSPVGTTEEIGKILGRVRSDLKVSHRCVGNNGGCGYSPVYLAHCPERVLPGQILRELVENDRIIGGIDPASTQKAEKFYRQFVSGQILCTDSRTAEMAKLTENAFRDVNIAFANELSLVCEKMHINVWELIRLANHHPRVNILQPGTGVGGHCIAVDPWFIIDAQPELSRLMLAARQINDEKPHYVVQKILDKAGRFKAPIIACLGLTYKPDVDDLRESPAIRAVQLLCSKGQRQILVVEPHISQLPDELSGKVELTDLQDALARTDIIVAMVSHKQFRAIEADMLKDKIVLDFVNVFEK